MLTLLDFWIFVHYFLGFILLLNKFSVVEKKSNSRKLMVVITVGAAKIVTVMVIIVAMEVSMVVLVKRW